MGSLLVGTSSTSSFSSPGQLLRLVDADENGVVTEQEISAVLARGPANMNPFDFASHDSNKDGKITKDESPSLFKKGNIDADGDGMITRKEFARLPGAKK